MGERMQARSRVVAYAFLAMATLFFLTPLAWMAMVSLKPEAEVYRNPPTLLPERPTAAAYGEVWQSESFDYPLYARNTLIIAVLSLAGTMVSSAMAAYGFARVPFRGRNALFAVCIATMMIPFPVLMVPSYLMFRELGWIGTLLPLWVPAWFGSAFNVFLLIPKDLEESALLDGCSRWGCFWRIMMPLATPALTVVGLFHLVAVWNDLVGPLIYLSHQHQFTLALGLQFLQSRPGDVPQNQLMAATTLIVLPVLVLFLFAQQAFIRGIATTGMKE
jgi:multiple sugar transport system permease protein